MIDKKKLSDAIKNSRDNPQKPPVDPNLTLDVKNEKLEELVKQYTDEKNADNLNALIEELRKCRLLVPANINEEKKPVPCMLNSKDKGMYFPVYTALKQIPQSPRSDAIINMPYLAVKEMTAQQQSIRLRITSSSRCHSSFVFRRLRKSVESLQNRAVNRRRKRCS